MDSDPDTRGDGGVLLVAGARAKKAARATKAARTTMATRATKAARATKATRAKKAASTRAARRICPACGSLDLPGPYTGDFNSNRVITCLKCGIKLVATNNLTNGLEHQYRWEKAD